jgi:hypothetical protein
MAEKYEEKKIEDPIYKVGDLVIQHDSSTGVAWKVIGVDETHYNLQSTAGEMWGGGVIEKYLEINTLHKIYKLN